MTILDLLTPVNFARGRGGVRPDVVVVHVMEGSMEGTLSWFRKKRENPTSAHYGISREGEVVRYVRDDDTAYHAGLVVRPTAPIVIERAGRNPNSYSIGIENEGYATEEPTVAQLEANGELVRLLAERHGFPIDRRHVVGHREIRADKTCPGLIDVNAIVQLAGGSARPVGPFPLLRRGDKGAEVRQLQRALDITVDGDFGPKTEEAVKLFQWRAGLDVDGLVGPRTWAALAAGRK